jgi:hypothetical protein
MRSIGCEDDGPYPSVQAANDASPHSAYPPHDLDLENWSGRAFNRGSKYRLSPEAPRPFTTPHISQNKLLLRILLAISMFLKYLEV